MIFILQSYGLAAKGVRINATSIKNKSYDSIMHINGKGSLINNITDIFGPKQSDTLEKFESLEAGDFMIEGQINTCQHGKGRSKPDRQFFFVNNRPCDLPNGSKSLNEIYHQFNRYQYPFSAIFISTKVQGNVDVNLTPDKRKIFIENESRIWDAFKSKLQQFYDKIAPPDLENVKLTNFFVQKEKPSSKNCEMNTITEKCMIPKLTNNGDCETNCEDIKTENRELEIENEIVKEQIIVKSGSTAKQDNLKSKSLSESIQRLSNTNSFEFTKCLLLQDQIYEERVEPANKKKKENGNNETEIRYDSFFGNEHKSIVKVTFSWQKMAKYYKIRAKDYDSKKEATNSFKVTYPAKTFNLDQHIFGAHLICKLFYSRCQFLLNISFSGKTIFEING